MSGFLCGWIPGFRLQAAAGRWPEAAAMAVERQGLLEVVAAANLAARESGVLVGMPAMQARGRCPALQVWAVNAEAERALARRLGEAADGVSPRVQRLGEDVAILDFAGLERLQKSAEHAAERLEHEFATAGFTLRTGIAAQPAMALLAARGGQRHLPASREAECLAPLPVRLLGEVRELTRSLATPEEVGEMLDLFERWGVRTLGDLAALPEAGLAARLGRVGIRLRELARGEAGGLLDTPPSPCTEIEAAMPFDPPLDDLEMLKAALGHALAPLTRELERSDRVVETTELRLELEGKKSWAEYTHAFAVPTREARTLAAQLQLELEREPPWGAVGRLELVLRLARPRRVQSRLFAAALPDAAKLPKLLGLLQEIFGREGRVGSPRLTDTHQAGAFTVEPYAPPEAENDAKRQVLDTGCLILRIFRPPQPLALDRVRIGRRAGPWRSLGGWWREKNDTARWEYDEWDVEMGTGLYRLLHDTARGQWFIAGRYD